MKLMSDDNQKMIDAFSKMEFEQLEDIVKGKSDDYSESAIKVACKVLKTRETSVVKHKPKSTIKVSEVHNGDVRVIGVDLPFFDVFKIVCQYVIASIPIMKLAYFIATTLIDKYIEDSSEIQNKMFEKKLEHMGLFGN